MEVFCDHCDEELGNETEVAECRHTFHTKCIIRHIVLVSNECPVCQHGTPLGNDTCNASIRLSMSENWDIQGYEVSIRRMQNRNRIPMDTVYVHNEPMQPIFVLVFNDSDEDTDTDLGSEYHTDSDEEH